MSDSLPHLGLHLQSVSLLSVAKLQHRFEQIKPLAAFWGECSMRNWGRILGRHCLPVETKEVLHKCLGFLPEQAGLCI